MSTFNRLISRRDKHHTSHKEKVMSSPVATPKPIVAAFSSSHHSSSSSLYSLSLAFPGTESKRAPCLQATIESIECSSANSANLLLQPKPTDGHPNGSVIPEGKEDLENEKSEEERNIKTLLQRLASVGITTFKDADVAYVLAGVYASGDVDKAYEMLVLLEDSESGIVHKYNPNVKLLGAINRGGVTCYLDALLFAMFARLGSFEAMLHQDFEDPPKQRLATLLRLWINTLRAGKLITTDITKQIQLQLSSCGWEEAAEVSQQDASEAFTFITETLALPLLTLKMDIFHTGKEDVSDDHKFINERLLELAIPDEPPDGRVITLEECLEMYFNNKIEVKRYLDQLERRNTVSSVRSYRSMESAKAHASHVEIAEVGDMSQPSSPMAPQTQPSFPMSSPRPGFQRRRAPSIIQEHYVDEKKEMRELSPAIDEKDEKGPPNGRVRKEVLMPAWQFFSLIPWYTDNVPSNDAQVAAHFSSTRPILGICLKRYSMLPNGTSIKRKTHIDIPLEIGLPHFIQDDRMSEDGPAFGNFKLSLQSVVCHQGNSTESGHYIALVRSPNPEQAGHDRWMRFDDLAADRVTYTDVEKFLLQESPYLVFYQVVPIEGEHANSNHEQRPMMDSEQPPAYTESDTSRRDSKVDSGISGISTSPRISFGLNERPNSDYQRPSLDYPRPSSDSSTSEDGRRGRSSSASERPEGAIADISVNGLSNANAGFLSAPTLEQTQTDGPNALTASRRGSKTTQTSSASRPSSQSDDKRMSSSISRLASRMSKDKLGITSGSASNTAGPRDGLSGPVAPSTQTKGAPVGAGGPAGSLVAATESLMDRSRQKREAKEQNKAANRDSHHLNNHHLTKMKRREGKPDRECLVM